MKEIKYTPTNTYLIQGEKGNLLLDTGWAGTFPLFCRAMGEQNEKIQDISYILLTHFHPDHMGIAQEIADHTQAQLVILEVQLDYVHSPDPIFAKEKKGRFIPIREEEAKILRIRDSRDFLKELGIYGEILHTPGHSPDSISLFLDDGSLFVGDLNPLYELSLHEGDEIGKTWKSLLERHPGRIYYGHAKTLSLEKSGGNPWTLGNQKETGGSNHVHTVVKYIKKGYTQEEIREKTGFDATFVEDVMRIYFTHPGVTEQGILDRLEIKGR